MPAPVPGLQFGLIGWLSSVVLLGAGGARPREERLELELVQGGVAEVERSEVQADVELQERRHVLNVVLGAEAHLGELVVGSRGGARRLDDGLGLLQEVLNVHITKTCDGSVWS